MLNSVGVVNLASQRVFLLHVKKIFLNKI